MAWYKKGTPIKQVKKNKTPEQRFMEKVELIPFHPCWEWTGTRSEWGYGQFWIGNGTRQAAPRWAFEHWVGPIGPGLVVCHRCDNPGCVNPDHLFLGTNQENADDMVRKGRSPKGKAGRRLSKAKREEIVRMVAQGVPQRKVAEQMGLSPKTVRKWVNETSHPGEESQDG